MDDKLILHTRTVGPWGVNAYGLICSSTGESALIDPGGDPDQLSEMLAGSMPVAILLTHSHPDHIGALAQMQHQLKVPVLAHPGNPVIQSAVIADRWFQDKDQVTVGDHRLQVLHTPGHTDDQVCFLDANSPIAIVGDTVFEGGPGKTWSTANFQRTLNTLKQTVLAWSDDTICFPGHGPSFRLGDIRKDIEAFIRADHGDFCGDATWGMAKS